MTRGVNALVPLKNLGESTVDKCWYADVAAITLGMIISLTIQCILVGQHLFSWLNDLKLNMLW